jgi:toxin-antitoxin system PIN domain toxin
MNGSLFDVNVLIALMWPAHEAHSLVQRWFSRHARDGWATCPLTEAAFVRIVANLAFSSDAVTPQEAVNILAANVQHPSHRFWGDTIGFSQAVQPFAQRLNGHQQVTDAYLLGLALHKKSRLVTMDRAILALLPEKTSFHSFIVLVQDEKNLPT